MPNVPHAKPDSTLPSDVPSLVPSEVTKTDKFFPSGGPTDLSSDVPSFAPSDVWTDPSSTVPTKRPVSHNTYPTRSPVNEGVFPPSWIDHASSSPTTVSKHDISQIASGTNSGINSTTQTNDTTFFTLLTVLIVVCSLAIVVVALLMIVRKTREWRVRHVGTPSRSQSREHEYDRKSDSDDGRILIHEAESVSSLSSMWKEDRHAEFDVLDSIPPQADSSLEVVLARPTYILTCRGAGSKGVGVDCKRNPRHSMKEHTEDDRTCLDETQYETNVLPEWAEVESESGDQGRFGNVEGRQATGEAMTFGPHHRSEPCVYDTTNYTTSGQLPGDLPEEGNRSFGESSVTLNPIDRLMDEFETQLEQWREHKEF